jgi:hypothetical protein
MDKPLTVWYCDICGDRIEDINKGYVIWETSHEMKEKSFKIIHQSKCDKKEFHGSLALQDFVGPEGITFLLSFMSIGPIKKYLGQGSHCSIFDFDEFVDFFHRVQTPYYEEARRFFKNERLLDFFSDSNEVGPYLPDRLKKIIEEYGAER